MVTAKQTPQILWLKEVEENDYLAADSYLRIIYTSAKVTEMVARLKGAAIVEFKAKDIFRASQLSLLGESNSHVEKEREKIIKGVRDRKSTRLNSSHAN